MKTCYYELLGVEQSSSESELKKAYRRKALQYHPDKNPDDPETATKIFAQIRLAYEVLSDPQERAWYDAHKSQILREDDDFQGGDDYDDYVEPEIAGTTVQEIMKFFDPSLYSRIDDSTSGMYYVASTVFNQLAKEEIIAGRNQGLDGYSKYQDDDFTDTTNILYPKFGNSKTDYAEKVRKFYQVWSSFSTVKTFSWKDEYRYSAASDRRTRRTMERENKKARDTARREYNETIRSYISFLKKRDPRVKEGAAKFEQERKKKQQEELRKQIEKDRAAQNDKRGQFQEQNWQTIDDLEFEEMERHFVSDSEHEEEPEDLEVFECVICDKIFKTANQFQAHEQSAKHKKLLAKLKWEMKQEGIVLGIDEVSDESDYNTADENSNEDSDQDSDHDADEDTDDDEDIDEELRKIEEEFKKMQEYEYNKIPVDDIAETEEENIIILEDKKGESEEIEVDDQIDSDLDESEQEIAVPKKLSKKEKKKQKYAQKVSPAKIEVDEVDELTKLSAALDQKISLEDDSDNDWSTGKKQKKKKPKRKTESLSKESTPSSEIKEQSPTSVPVNALSEVCTVCQASFPSRNKLFQHVNATGHALAPPKKKKGSKKKK